MNDDEEEQTVRQRQQILADLRQKAGQSVISLDAEKRKREKVALEVAELRGRLSHASKEHAQWEQDLQASEMKQMGEAMEDLRRWRKEKPQAASEIARQRAAEAALSMEGHGGGSAAASSQRGFGGLLEGGSEWE